MNLFTNIPIRYKLFSGFSLVLLLFIAVMVYILFTFNTIAQLLGQLDIQGDRRTTFLTLNTDTKQLSDAIKSYILTKDPKWERVYNTTSLDLDTTLSNISTSGNIAETKDLATFKETSTKLQGVELLILEKTKNGNTAEAIKLFDTNYIEQQTRAANLVNNLVTSETDAFDQTLTQNNNAIAVAKNALVISLLINIFIIILISLYFVHIIESSILKLIHGVNKIAEGNLEQRIPITSQDEIGKLATAFNGMAEKLQASYSGLEEKIQEKTLQLSEKVTDLETAKIKMEQLLKDLQEQKKIVDQEKAKDDILLESIGDGMIAIDPETKILKINPVAREILDIEGTEIVGKDISETFSIYGMEDIVIEKDKRPEFIAIQTAKPITELFTIKRKDGTKHMINFIANPVVEANAVVGAIMIIRDVTKEREVDRMKTEFISLASHQLRTPLSAIKWFTEMLVNGDAGVLNSEQAEFAKNIGESTERMIQLVNALLNISRIESGRIMIDPQPTDLKELVTGITKELQVKTLERQQNLIVSVHEDLPKINIDPKLIRQVYLNLLTNAIKYTKKGGDISVFISKKGAEIISQVTDNGYGIPKDQQYKIFQKFFRAQNVAKFETDGTGLGLYLIKAIVESSQGRIWFESEEGKGTTFWFSLPLAGMTAKKGEVTLDE